jgi:hypothetical protein
MRASTEKRKKDKSLKKVLRPAESSSMTRFSGAILPRFWKLFCVMIPGGFWDSPFTPPCRGALLGG